MKLSELLKHIYPSARVQIYQYTYNGVWDEGLAQEMADLYPDLIVDDWAVYKHRVCVFKDDGSRYNKENEVIGYE